VAEPACCEGLSTASLNAGQRNDPNTGPEQGSSDDRVGPQQPCCAAVQGCTGLSAAGLSQLKHCKRLQYLDLSGTRIVGLYFLEIRDVSLDFAGPKKGVSTMLCSSSQLDPL